MRKKQDNTDRIRIKQKKGTWLRFIKLFPKCRLPWLFLGIYIILEIGVINIGVNETEYTAQLFAGDTSPALLARLIGVIILNLVGSNILIFMKNFTSARINRNMRKVVLGKVLRLPMTFFKDENPREAIYRIVNNSIVIDSTIMLFIIPVFTAAYKAFTVFTKVFKYDWRLSVILLAFIPIQILIAFIFGRLNFSVSERSAAVTASLTQRLAELVTNIPLAKAFAKEKKETENGEELTSRLYKLSIKGSWLDQFKDFSNTFVDLAQSVIIVVVGVVLLGGGSITVKSWIAFFMFSSVFSGAITELLMYWNNIKIIQGGGDKVAEIMNAPEENRSGEPCENMSGSLKVENVRFGYSDDKTVFSDLSCEFKDNCVTALLGESGCGKTTLVNILTRLYSPQEGKITVEGKDIHGFALEDYRNQFAVVSQSSMLFSGTVRENVCYGNGEVSDEVFYGALKKAGAFDFVMKLPDKENSVLEEYGGNLSGGQRQRLAVARALISKAHYLILDEPAASMDAIASAELMEILKEAASNRCMIIIAHTPSVIPMANRVVIIEDGTVTAQGDAEELKKTNAFLHEFIEGSV